MKKARKYYHTIRHTKVRQLFYRIIFRAKEKTAYSWLQLFSYDRPFHPLTFASGELINSAGKYLAHNSFRFLNIERDFGKKINWHFEGKEKLWYLNLQYFDYLLDSGIERQERIRLVEEYCGEVEAGKIWLESYPISLRLVNWILFASKESYYSERFLYCLQWQTKFLKHNLEYHILANHYLENIISLTVCAHAFRDIDLLEFSLKRLRKELNEEILDDGGHFECTPMYHCIILSRLLILIDIFQNNPWSGRDHSFLESCAAKMLGWLQQYAFRDDTLAHFNDSTDHIAPNVRTIFRTANNLNITPKFVSLSSSGYRKLYADSAEIIVDVGNIIPEYQPGHAHSDMLSFCMNINAKAIFIDPGISTYDVSVQRSKERSTCFHNTVTINNINQSHVWGAFRVAKRAKLTLLSDTFDYLSAFHDGYKEELGVIHRRVFQVEQNKLCIVDYISGTPSEKLKCIAYFYLDPEVRIDSRGSSNILLNDDINVCFSNCLNVTREHIEIPAGYNKYQYSNRISVEFEGYLKTEIFFKIKGL